MTEEQNIAGPIEPVYPLFGVPNSGSFELPIVKARRGPIVYRQPTTWDHRRYEIRRKGWKVRRWFRSHWWPSRIRDLERRIAYLIDELDHWG